MLGKSTLLLVSGMSVCASANGESVDECAYVQQVRAQTLAELYQLNPQARSRVESAAGYGVFSDIGHKVFVVAAGNGYAVVRDNATGQDTYLKMLEFGGGIGMGVKEYSAV